MKNIHSIFLMALLLLAGVQAEAKKVRLAYKLKAGDSFVMEKVSQQDVTQDVMGNTQKMTSTTTMDYGFKVVSVDPAGETAMEVAMTAFAMQSSNPMAGEMKYDSRTDTVVPDYARMLAVTLNQAYTVTLSPQGKVLSCKVPDGLIEKVTKVAESLGGNQMAALGNNAAGSVSEEAFLKNLGFVLLEYPEGDIQAKQTWENESKLQQMVALAVKTKYELKDSDKNSATIRVTGTITQDPGAPPMEMQGMTISYELLGAQEGLVQVDTASGMPVSCDVTTTISGSVSIDSPQMGSPMTIPMTIRVTEKITRK